MGIRFTILVLLLISSNIDGRPISYSGGSTLMMFSDNMKDSIYYHYSPTYKYSVGIEQVKDKYFKENSSYLRLTYLADRKNTCLLYTSPSPRGVEESRMPSSA